MIQVDSKDVFKALGKIQLATVKNVNNLNKRRAERFKEQTKKDLNSSKYRLAANTEATEIIQGLSHDPLYIKGTLVDKMELKELDAESVDAGYFNDNNEIVSGGKITYATLAMIQTTGYRIPLQGDKGNRVRGFLAKHGIFPRADREFLNVKPRPFLYRAYEDALKNGNDEKVINDYMDELWRSL
jgi:hypothetical protein